MMTGASAHDFLGHLAWLTEAEQALTDTAAASDQGYVRLGNYLAQPGPSLRALPRSLVGRPLVPAWKLVRLARMTREWLRGNSEQVASTACLIEARPHWKQSGMFRSFYDKSQSTMKLAIHSETGRKRMTREIRARLIVEEINCIRTPKLLGRRDTPDSLAILEEWIDGRTFRRYRDMPAVCRVLLPQLARHYETYGIQEISLDAAMQPGFAQRVIKAADLFRWPRHWVDKRTFLAVVEQLGAAQLNLPGSFCHGDLGMGHVLFDGQGLPIVIDWDGGGEGPIASDIAKLNRFLRPYSRQLLGRSLELLRTWSTPTTYSPHAQLLIGGMRSASFFQQRAASRPLHGRPDVSVKQLYRVFRYGQWLLRQDTSGAVLAGCGKVRM